MALTVREFLETAKGGCQVPGCSHANHNPMFMHQRCHPKQGTWVSLDTETNVLKIECRVCHQVVVEVDLSQGTPVN